MNERRALVGNLWSDPLGRLWCFFDQSLGYFDGRCGDWYIRCDDPDAAEPKWTEPVRFADGWDAWCAERQVAALFGLAAFSASAADRIAAVGSAFCWPAMSGAEPCTGSNMLG